jgi:predicted enzyme related to lactoylglutathione lyase
MNTPENNLRLDYVEFASRDVAAAKQFFSAAFGWKFTDYGPDYTSFADGRMTGGIYAAPDAPAPSTGSGPVKTNPLIVIFATNLEDAEARVKRAGGRIVKPAFEFPGGRRFHFAEPSGLELAVWSDVRADGTRIA